MDFPGQAKAKREAAARARRIAQQLSLIEDRERILKFAVELDAQAKDLEGPQGGDSL